MSSLKCSFSAAKAIALVIMGATIALAGPTMASTLMGTYYTGVRATQPNVSVAMDQDGDLLGYGLTQTTPSAPGTAGGLFTFSPATPAAGATKTYELYFNEMNIWYRQFEFGVPVSSTSGGQPMVTTRDHLFNYPDCITGVIAMQEVPAYYQTFRARGNWISSVGLWQQKEFGPMTTISILASGPWGAQIGPSRTITTQVTDASTAYWNAGEIPVTPGQIYCVKLYAPWQGVVCGGHGVQSEACRPFIPSVFIQNSNAYPDGQTWCTDSSGQGLYTVPGPVAIVINQDTDGITTTVNTRKTKDPAPYQQTYTSCAIAGQTFTAKGTSLLSFSCLLGSTGTQSYYASVFTGPGAKGMGTGTRIGPRKFLQPVDWNFRSAVVWAPGEVPLTPGQQYYVCLQTSQSQQFTIYTDQIASEKYLGGSAYIYSDTRGTGGITNYDLSTTICEESYHGSTSTPTDTVSNVVTTRGSTTTTISWQTATANNSSTYVEFGSDTPYSTIVTDSTPSSTIHTVTLTGLTPNLLYHARITAVPAVLPPTIGCYNIGQTRDFVFVTNSTGYPNDNLLANGGFENGTWTQTTTGHGTHQAPLNWTIFWDSNSDDIGIHAPYPYGLSSWYFNGLPHSGNHFFGNITNGAGPIRAGVYQTITNLVPGRPLYVHAWVWTVQTDQFGALQPYAVCGRIGIDLSGGTIDTATGVIWSRAVSGQDQFGPLNSIYTPNNGQTVQVTNGSWTEVWITATPTGTTATIFLQGGATLNMAWDASAWDDAYAAQGPPPGHFTSPGTAKTQPDGTLLSIGDSSHPLIVTITPKKSGDGSWYVEDNKRTGALRIQSGDSPNLGDSVTVLGTMYTTPAGERYLSANTALTSDTTPPVQADPFYIIQPYATSMLSLGKAGLPASSHGVYSGADNTGMLVRITGKVFNLGDNGFVWTADGSLNQYPKTTISDPYSGQSLYPGVIKVITSNQGLPLFDGDTYELTGIVTLSGFTPQAAVPIFILRGDEDAIDLGSF